MLTRYTIYVRDPATDRRLAQLATYDADEALQVVLMMRAELPDIEVGAVGRPVAVEELAAMGGREVEA